MYQLLLLYEHITRRRATRRVYGASQSQGEFAEFVRAAARPLLGRSENLDAQLREAIQRHRPLRDEMNRRGFYEKIAR